MVCKCGATVKASEHRAEITQIWGFAVGHRGEIHRPLGIVTSLARRWEADTYGRLIPSVVRLIQEFGTIAARPYSVTAGADRARRALAGSNSMRRSNAVVRIIG